MKVGIFLSYIGLGSNIMHLAYCHEIAKKYGPVTVSTFSNYCWLCAGYKADLFSTKIITIPDGGQTRDNFKSKGLACKYYKS